jgi:hypothetical protein
VLPGIEALLAHLRSTRPANDARDGLAALLAFVGRAQKLTGFQDEFVEGGDGTFGGELERPIVTRFSLVLQGGDLLHEPEQRRMSHGSLFHGLKCRQVAVVLFTHVAPLDLITRCLVVAGVEIRERLAQPGRPLLDNMKGTPLERYAPIPDTEPKVAEHVRRLLQDALEGKSRPEDYSSAAWQLLLPKQAEAQSELKFLGSLLSLKPVYRGTEDGKRGHRYRLEFQKVTLLMHFIFDEQDTVVTCETEAME